MLEPYRSLLFPFQLAIYVLDHVVVRNQRETAFVAVETHQGFSRRIKSFIKATHTLVWPSTIFMYLTDYREESLEDVIRKLEPSLFERVTGLTIDDFDLLLRVGVFNRAQMNDAILKFRRYEDASLAYTGVNRHASDTRIGLMDSTVPIEALVDREKG